MRLLVISDSHGDWDKTLEILKHEPHDFSVHLGDSEVDKSRVAAAFDVFVAGNHDTYSPLSVKFQCDDCTVLAVHGHLHFSIVSVIYGGRGFKTAARLILFGHMHVPFFKRINDKLYVCPGAVALPRSPYGATYAIVNIKNSDISVIFKSAVSYQTINYI